MTNTAWAMYWTKVGNEDYLAAKKLLELSPRVESHFRAYARGEDNMDWTAAIEAIASSGMSSTEHRLADLVAGLIDGSDHKVPLITLSRMSEWTDDVLHILVQWATDGRLSVSGKLLADDPWIKQIGALSDQT